MLKAGMILSASGMVLTDAGGRNVTAPRSGLTPGTAAAAAGVAAGFPPGVAPGNPGNVRLGRPNAGRFVPAGGGLVTGVCAGNPVASRSKASRRIFAFISFQALKVWPRAIARAHPTWREWSPVWSQA